MRSQLVALAYGRAKFLEQLRHAFRTEILVHVDECASRLHELLKKIKARFVRRGYVAIEESESHAAILIA
jgi:hypothetical protein